MVTLDLAGLSVREVNQQLRQAGDAGDDVTILELTETIMKVVGYEGEIIHDLTKPDGPPKKIMDNSKLSNMGWSPHYRLEEGLRHAYDWFLNNKSKLRS